MLIINSNGSKWFEQPSDSIDNLKEVLKYYALDPKFEKHGNFVNRNPQWVTEDLKEKYKGCSTIFGNFLEISHIFSIITNDEKLLAEIEELVNENKKRPEYQDARALRFGNERNLLMGEVRSIVKVLNLIVQDRNDFKNPKEFVESYAVREDVQNPEQALRNAIKEFVCSGTEEAKTALSYACGCFNWGDALCNVPESIFIKHGLTPMKQNAVDVFVDHDEILADNDPDDLFHKIKQNIREHIKRGEREIRHWEEAENMVAESMANAISLQNEKLTLLLGLEEITEDTMTKLIEEETDDNLILIYENIRDVIADIEM